MLEAYRKIYERRDNTCDFCEEEIEKGKIWIIDRYQCHLECYAKNARKEEK